MAQLKPNEAILNQINLDPGGIAVTAQAEYKPPGMTMNISQAQIIFLSKLAKIHLSDVAFNVLVMTSKMTVPGLEKRERDATL